MNTNILLIVLSTVIINMQCLAMEQAAVDTVQTVVKNPALTVEIIGQSSPAQITVQPIKIIKPCIKSIVQDYYQKAVELCKKHPMATIACVAIVTAVIIYNVIPKRKEVIGSSSYQMEALEFDAHEIPQEKLDEESLVA